MKGLRASDESSDDILMSVGKIVVPHFIPYPTYAPFI